MIRLVVVDVDGVLSHGEAAPFDFAVLQRLAEFNEGARQDPTSPALTLCTGRPAPYVEVLMQAIHGYYPAVYENGAGLYIPEPYGFKWHPAITPTTQAGLLHLQAVLHDVLVAADLAYFQPGKAASLSLFPCPGVSLDELARKAGQVADDIGGQFVIERAMTCINVLVSGVDKAEGVRWLSRETGIPLGEMAGVGDAQSDMKFMQLLHWSGTPANAHASVKRLAHYTSPFDDGPGLVDILARLPRA